MKVLQDRVAQIYYTHGLFCASHPVAILTALVCLMLVTFFPLIYVPLPGTVPKYYTTPVSPDTQPHHTTQGSNGEEEGKMQPHWFKGKPLGYIQQIVVKVAVSPWKPDVMTPSDAYRSPLSKVFQLIDKINHFQYNEGSGEDYSLSDICFRVSEATSARYIKDLLPEYSCMVLSPANLWQSNLQRFRDDEVLRTIFKRHGQALETPPYPKDILFGLPWTNTGISRYFIRNKQRTISYAVTLVLKKYDHKFLDALKKKLIDWYPETVNNVNLTEPVNIVHVHYQEIKFMSEYTYLVVTYIVLFLYLYFSVSKIDMVKSKGGLAFSAVFTVVASLLMSVSICTMFGLTPTLNGGEIFPYLVVLIGVENILVITKSVVSTPVDLEVKYRIAQGISKEGWYITKNLATELMIVVGGFVTFVPQIQEFAVFALVGLLTDFFLQVVFFVTVLSVDIRRMELSDLHKRAIRRSTSDSVLRKENMEPLVRCPVMTLFGTAETGSKSPGAPSQPVKKDGFLSNPQALQSSRRLKLIDFIGRTRALQKCMMVCTVIWIGLIVYKSGLVEHLTNSTIAINYSINQAKQNGGKDEYYGMSFPWGFLESEEISPVNHTEAELWKDLNHKHWLTMFGYYNISLYGRYISIIPSIHISMLINPQEAIQFRQPSDGTPEQQSNRGDFSASNDMTEVTVEGGDFPPHYMYDSEHFKQFYPKSRREYVITMCFGILSVICISYFVVALYHCICPRNYAKWRQKWSRNGRKNRNSGYIRQIKASVPKVLKGHAQEIECLATDGHFIVSTCLGGQLRVWDSITGECVTVILRKSVTPPMKRKPCVGRNIEDSDADLYAEYHGDDSSVFPKDLNTVGPRQRSSSKRQSTEPQRKLFTNQPDLSSSVYTNFSSLSNDDPLSLTPSPQPNNAGFDFRGQFGSIYTNHQRFLQENGDGNLGDGGQTNQNDEWRSRSWSAGDLPVTLQHDASLFDTGFQDNQAPPIWCLSFSDGLVAAGCGNGRIELWDGASGTLKNMFGDSRVGVTSVCLVGNRVVAARLNGTIDFIDLETFHNPAFTSTSTPNTSFTKGHSRQYSQAKVKVESLQRRDEIIHMTLMKSIKAHQQQIVSLQYAGTCRKIISASQDHTLKVFQIDDAFCLYTLHGHSAKITVLYIDKVPPFYAASGDADGIVRLWDLQAGTCLHKVKGHDGAVVSINSTDKHVISSGLDDKLCIWDRKKGCIQHSLDLDPCGNNCLSLLSKDLLVTGGQGCIHLLDIIKGQIIKTISLGDNTDKLAFVHQIKVVESTVIVCDYASDMKVIHFPTVLEKVE